MTEYNLRGVRDDDTWDVMQDNYFSLGDRCKEFLKEYRNKSKQIFKFTDERQLKCHQKAQLAEQLLISIIAAMRKELKIPFDEQAYREMMAISHKKWKQNLDKHIASKKKAYADFISKFEL